MGFTGRTGVALAQIDDAEARPPGLSNAAVGLLRTSMRAIAFQDPAAIRAAVEGNLAAAAAGPGGTINAILILSALGRLDEAFSVVNGYMLRRGASVTPARAAGLQAVLTDTSHRHSQLLFVPVTAPLRADARFLPMCEACGLAEYWRQSGHPPDFLAGKPV
jgi:hypothetical protein